MFEIDKQRFGKFVAELRKEKRCYSERACKRIIYIR